MLQGRVPRIARCLTPHLRDDHQTSVMLRTRKQMGDIVERAPAGFGASPATYRYDVVFLRDGLTASTAMKSVPTKEGVDQVHAGAGVLYTARLISRASQSRLSRIVSLPIYQSMTVRNWNTTTKLLQMMEAREASITAASRPRASAAGR